MEAGQCPPRCPREELYKSNQGKAMSWSKKIIHWVENRIAYISIVFTWQLPQAYSLCVWYSQQGYKVRAGGPAVKLMPEYLNSVADISGEIIALPYHNPQATYTSRGCIRQCDFCAVPQIEGDLIELENWEPKPIICDNNLLACSKKHFDAVIDRLKPLRDIDFNQGLDARILSPHHITRLKELELKILRFAWDNVGLESVLLSAIDSILKAGFPKSKLRVYILFNYKDTPDDALYRCETLKNMGIFPNVQRYQPLNSLQKDSYISLNWNGQLLKDFTRYWSRQLISGLKAIDFAEYNPHKRT